jgi:hypothetical protein
VTVTVVTIAATSTVPEVTVTTFRFVLVAFGEVSQATTFRSLLSTLDYKTPTEPTLLRDAAATLTYGDAADEFAYRQPSLV